MEIYEDLKASIRILMKYVISYPQAINYQISDTLESIGESKYSDLPLLSCEDIVEWSHKKFALRKFDWVHIVLAQCPWLSFSVDIF